MCMTSTIDIHMQRVTRLVSHILTFMNMLRYGTRILICRTRTISIGTRKVVLGGPRSRSPDASKRSVTATEHLHAYGRDFRTANILSVHGHTKARPAVCARRIMKVGLSQVENHHENVCHSSGASWPLLH